MGRKTKAKLAQGKGVPDLDEFYRFRVLTKAEAAQLAGMSADTLDRLIRAGNGPRCVQLSPRRVGIVLRDFRAWLDSRPLPRAAA
jgi:predicted DNA-binding transcriptional regulator AlpA